MFKKVQVFNPAQNKTEATKRLEEIFLKWELEQLNDLLEMAEKPNIQTKIKTAKKFI